MANHTTKNYMTENGDELVIGGKLVFDGGALEFSEDAAPVANQEDSTAGTVTALKDDFNALLAKLKAAGLMEADDD